MQAETYDLITRFLLGKLGENERLAIEERFLSENEFFEQVLSVESELLDQYLLGRLSKDDMARAQSLFQSSRDQQARVESTRSLINLIRASKSSGVRSKPEASPPGLIGSTNKPEISPAVADRIDPSRRRSPLPAGLGTTPRRFHALTWVTAGLVFVLLGSCVLYLLYKKKVLETQQASVDLVIRAAGYKTNDEIIRRLNDEIGRRAALEEELNSERQRRQKLEELLQLRRVSSNSISTVLLTPTTFERDGGSKLVRLNVAKGQVRLQLVVNEDQHYDFYTVLITTFDNHKVWDTGPLSSHSIKQGKLTVALPAGLIGYQDYKIELKGSSDKREFFHVADYAMRVSR